MFQVRLQKVQYIIQANIDLVTEEHLYGLIGVGVK
jgi:hypothetical protein